MKLTDLLNQIDRLEGHITPGPWEAVGRPYNACVSPAGQIRNLARLGDPLDPEAWKNAEFIALARTALPQLAKALQAVMDCVIDMEEDNGDDSAYSHGVRHMAGTVRHIITDTLKGDDDA